MKSILWLLPALVAFTTAVSAQTRSILTLSVAQPTATEEPGGTGLLVVRRSQGSDDSLRVAYRVSGSARNGIDYERLPGWVEIPAGGSEAMIEIIPLDDNKREGTERVTVQLRPAPRGGPPYRLAGRRAQTIQILDDEQPARPRPPPIGGVRPPWFPANPSFNPTNAPTRPTP